MNNPHNVLRGGVGYCSVSGTRLRKMCKSGKSITRSTIGTMIEARKEHVARHDWRPVGGGDMGYILSPDGIECEQLHAQCVSTA